MDYFIKPSADDAAILNQDCMWLFVTQDGVNFMPPFEAGTTTYINLDYAAKWCIYIDDRVATLPTNSELSPEKQAFYAALFEYKKDLAQASAAGWLPKNPPTAAV